MGKGGAPTTTNTAQNQSVSYTPTGLQGFQDIYNKAAGVASQPYQPYTGQLVQGLNPTQTGAISNITNAASQPLQANQIQQYMNPFQNNVIDATMANINETNRQQMADTTGKLTQSAGGVGASRIALGQGELARQQGLASNQTLAGLQQQNYMQALATAQQQQGFGLGASQAQLGAGGLEQQTGQAGLTANYQQYLQQLAFPYQQAQFLAGIGLPALGGMGGQQNQTGTANQVVTPPGMTLAQGLAGAGSIGYGLFKGYGPGSGGGDSGGGVGDTASYAPAEGVGEYSARGGRIRHYADGGEADTPDPYEGKSIDLGKGEYHDDALAPVVNQSSYVPQAASPKVDAKMPAPMAPIPAPSQGSGSGSGSSGGVDWGSIAKIAGTAAMFLLKDGGRVGYDDGGQVQQGAYPTPAMLGSPLTRGALPQRPDLSSPNVFYGRPLPNMLPSSPVTGNQANQNIYEQARQAYQQQQMSQALAAMRGQGSDSSRVSVSANDYAEGGHVSIPEYASGEKTRAAIREFRPSKHDEYLEINPDLWDSGGNYPMPSSPRQGTPTDNALSAEPQPARYADGGDVDDDDSDRHDNPIYNYFHPQTFDQRWGDTPIANNPYPQPDRGYMGFPSTQLGRDPSANTNVSYRFPNDMPPAATLPNTDSANAAVNRRSMEAGDLGFMNADAAQQLKMSLAAKAAGMRPAPQPVVPNKPDEVPTDISGDRASPYSRPSPGGGGPFDPATASPRDIMNLDNYKNQVAQRPTVRGLMNNPDFWMRAGLNILAANPAHGPLSAIAGGAGATVGEYDKWSKEDLSSKQKAQELAGKLMEHANKYTKLTANEKARLDIEHERLKQGHYQAINYTDENGQLKAGRFDTRTGQMTDNMGQPINPARIFGRSAASQDKPMTDKELLAATPGAQVEDLPRLRSEYEKARTIKGAPGSKENPIPDPGEGKRKTGVFYRRSDGAVAPWQGE